MATTGPMMPAADDDDRRRLGWAAWSIVAAFGTYFCMYAFRKPFTAAGYEEAALAGIPLKTWLVTAQVMGYMVSKFIGIKVIAEMPPQRRAMGILVLIGLAEFALLLFGLAPRPWDVVCLFFNGLPLGMVFGLVLGVLEGRRLTEFLTAGLCASFILADGVVKSVGAWLLVQGVSEQWMPFFAGLVFAPALFVFVWMLSRIPAPDPADVASRTQRTAMNRTDRASLYGRFAFGLTLLIGMYLMVTVVRSIRADYAERLWRELGVAVVPGVFTYSEIVVALGVLLANGCVVFVRDNRRAFFGALATCGLGFACLGAALVGLQAGWLTAFWFMVLAGLGAYLPYVAIHTTVFERLLAMTRERGNIGYLMYVADAWGYLGYVAVMLGKNFAPGGQNVMGVFTFVCLGTTILSLGALAVLWQYFANRRSEAALAVESAA
jgi:hypothetical protein